MSHLLRTLQCAGIAAALIASSAAARAQTGEAEEFTAFAINMGALTSGGTASLIITVNQWSSQEERDALFATLREKGADALLAAMRRAKRVGTLRTPDSVGYDLRLALEEPGKDGGRRVLLVTDRPVSFGEATNRPPSMDYPFTVMDIHMPREGNGEGTLSL